MGFESMEYLPVENFRYDTTPQRISLFSRIAPSLSFYARFLWIVAKSAYKAKRGQFNDSDWNKSSLSVLMCLESVGMRFSFSGIDHLKNLDGPCVFIGNHMSILETLILPCVIQPIRKVTFVVKESLLKYPVFKYIMASRNPVSVTRTQPREDLKRVMSGGVERIEGGISVIVFPQTTRSYVFDRQQFSTIGVKLAKKAKVPIVPIALKTDAWQNGNILKDFGKLNVGKTVHIAFGSPILVTGKGSEEHDTVIAFIEDKLQQWGSDETGGAL